MNNISFLKNAIFTINVLNKLDTVYKEIDLKIDKTSVSIFNMYKETKFRLLNPRSNHLKYNAYTSAKDLVNIKQIATILKVALVGLVVITALILLPVLAPAILLANTLCNRQQNLNSSYSDKPQDLSATEKKAIEKDNVKNKDAEEWIDEYQTNTNKTETDEKNKIQDLRKAVKKDKVESQRGEQKAPNWVDEYQTDEDDKAMEKVWISIPIESQLPSKEERFRNQSTIQFDKLTPAKKDASIEKLENKPKAMPHKRLVKAQDVTKDPIVEKLKSKPKAAPHKKSVKAQDTAKDLIVKQKANRRLNNIASTLLPNPKKMNAKSIGQTRYPNSHLPRSKM